MLLTAKSFCDFVINAWSFPRKNVKDKISRRRMLRYHFKTKRKIFTAISFCFFEINDWSLPPKNFNFLTKKLKAVEVWKVAYTLRGLIVNI